MMERDLEITKVAAEDNSPIEGAKFKVFGPFNENEAIILFRVGNGEKLPRYGNSGKDLLYYHIKLSSEEGLVFMAMPLRTSLKFRCFYAAIRCR